MCECVLTPHSCDTAPAPFRTTGMSNVWDPLLPRRHSSVARVYYSASESSKHASAAEGGGRLPMARTITWLQLMMIVYFNTVGGAFGIEPAVGAGGPLFCLIAVVLVSLALAAPQYACVCVWPLASARSGERARVPVSQYLLCVLSVLC